MGAGHDTGLGGISLAFLSDLNKVITRAAATDGEGRPMSLEDGLERALVTFRTSAAQQGKVIFIGNGGSAGIASHIAIDMWKNGRIDAQTFNDASLLTCLSNDCGFENVFSLPVERFARKVDTLVAISSSGRSPNILNGVSAARHVGCAVVTFSGFDADNPLRQGGDINFHVPSTNYGLVEVGHVALLHAILDAHMGYQRSSTGSTRESA